MNEFNLTAIGGHCEDIRNADTATLREILKMGRERYEPKYLMAVREELHQRVPQVWPEPITGRAILDAYAAQPRVIGNFRSLEEKIDEGLIAAKAEARSDIVDSLTRLRREMEGRINPFGPGAREQEKKLEFLTLITDHVRAISFEEEA